MYIMKLCAGNLLDGQLEKHKTNAVRCTDSHGPFILVRYRGNTRRKTSIDRTPIIL
jgi:hypothetical protein